MNGLCPISVDDTRHQLIEMGGTVVRLWLLRSFYNEVDDICNRPVLVIAGSLTNIVAGLNIGHPASLCGISVSNKARSFWEKRDLTKR